MFSLKRIAAPLLLSSVLALPAAAQDLMFTLINNSGFVLMEFYASPTDVQSWEEDILGANVLPSGSATDVLIADGRSNCDYDMLMVFEDGSTLQDAVNMCDMGSYTIN